MVGHRGVDTHAKEEDWIKGLSVFPSCRRRRGTSPELVLSPNLAVTNGELRFCKGKGKMRGLVQVRTG